MSAPTPYTGPGCCRAAYDSDGNAHDHPVTNVDEIAGPAEAGVISAAGLELIALATSSVGVVEVSAKFDDTPPAPTGPEPEVLQRAIEYRLREAAEEAQLRSQVSALQADVARLEGERDAMRPVVEAAVAWSAMRAGTPTKPKPESLALLAAVERHQHPLVTVAVSTQDAPSRLPLTRQSDAEGSGVAQDVREALGPQTGTQGASEAAYEAGVTEGRRQAVAAIRERVGDIAATEWAALIVEEEGR